VDSTIGGDVTDPGEGTFTYPQGTVVDLLAEPDVGYQFVNWTGDTATIADVDAADTTITMNGNYAITANFEEIPVSPADQKLIGADDASGSNSSSGYFRLSRFQAVASGNMTEFKVKAGAIGNVKCALYTDKAGGPGSLITAMNTGQAVTSGWNTLSFTSTPITSGIYYWLAMNIDTSGAAQYVLSPGAGYRYKAQAYSGFTFPETLSGLTTDNLYYDLSAGWDGTGVPGQPPAAPTRNCSVLTLRWNASAGATNYILQVNTSADFTGTYVFNGEVGNVTSREVTGLTAGTTYYYRIMAGNVAGWSGWSSAGSMRCGGVE
jgi:uncharacterized repeat protein (TIGR02543 family)